VEDRVNLKEEASLGQKIEHNIRKHVKKVTQRLHVASFQELHEED
jgi:hypothetical protein